MILTDYFISLWKEDNISKLTIFFIYKIFLTKYRCGKEIIDFKHSWTETMYGKRQNEKTRLTLNKMLTASTCARVQELITAFQHGCSIFQYILVLPGEKLRHLVILSFFYFLHKILVRESDIRF